MGTSGISSFSLPHFDRLATTGSRLAIRPDEAGTPTLQIAPNSLKGRILEWLSYVPLLKNLSSVQAHRQAIENDRNEVFRAFVQALKNTYSDADAEAAIAEHDLQNRERPPPLTHTLLHKLLGSAIKNADARNLVEQTTASAARAAAENAEKAKIAEQARIPAVGLPNLGNTCYANASIKFLVGTTGIRPLFHHLHDLSRTEAIANAPARAAAIGEFMDLLGSLQSHSSPDMRPFLNALRQTDELKAFNLFVMNDAQEFLAKLDSIFALDGIKGSSVSIRETLVNGAHTRARPDERSFSHEVNVAARNMSLQDIVNLGIASDTVEIRWAEGDANNVAVQKNRQYVADLDSLDRFNLHINALQYDVATDEMTKVRINADFNQPVVLPVLDSKTGKEWLVTLEPKDMIIHSGSAMGGHYYMYSKEGNSHWIVHDDRTVQVNDEVRRSDQPKFISFEVVDKVLASSATHTRGDAENAHTRTGKDR